MEKFVAPLEGLIPRRCRVGCERTLFMANETSLWFIAREGQQFGPFTWSQMLDMARLRSLMPSDLVWSADYNSWTQGSNVVGLFSPSNLPATPSPSILTKPNAGQKAASTRKRLPETPANYTKRQKRGLVGVIITVACLAIAASSILMYVRYVQVVPNMNHDSRFGRDGKCLDWSDAMTKGYMDECYRRERRR